MFDTLLKGGTVYDGSGMNAFVGDIGIKNQYIVAIGDLRESESVRQIDVADLAVAPGFIDLHTHSDFTLLADGHAESQVHQGVTTEVVGQCGMSCAPVLTDEDIACTAIGYVDGCVRLGWRSFGDYLERLEATDLGVNVAAFVGHGTVHRAVVGDALRPPDEDEVAQMGCVLEEALEEGACGFSTGLEYWPGNLASVNDLVALCSIAARHDVLYASHVRNRDLYYDLGFGEALATSRLSGARLQISHIQPKFGAPRHAMEHTLEMIERAHQQGSDIGFDVIPHDWSHTLVMAILPQWAQEGGISRIIDRLRDPATRERIKRNPRPMWRLVLAGHWDKIVLLQANKNREFIGATFAEIGRSRGIDPYDAVLDLLLEEGDGMGQALWTSHSFSDADIRLCLSQSECGVISDTLALAPYGVLEQHIGSLSGYGWAARFLQNYIRERGIITLQEAIRRLTAVPANQLQLKDRGRLRPGLKADITVFDAAEIASHCSVLQPRVYASGIAHVFVNGQLAIDGGNRMDVNAGQVIRRQRYR